MITQWPGWDRLTQDPFNYAWGTTLDGVYYLVQIIEGHHFSLPSIFSVQIDEHTPRGWTMRVSKPAADGDDATLKALVDELRTRLPEYLVASVL